MAVQPKRVAYSRDALKYGPPAAVGMFHWSFLAAPYPIPEKLIEADYTNWLTLLMGRWCSQKHGHKVMEIIDSYIDAYKNEGVIRGACEDYRAGATIDVENEKTDLVIHFYLNTDKVERRQVCGSPNTPTI